MRKKVTLGLLLAFAVVSISATNRNPAPSAGINLFKESNKGAVIETKKQNKPLHIDAYAHHVAK
jgi:hypothetical protein